jgi:hypothetical protein
MPPESEPSKTTRLFRKKVKQLDEEALIEIERHRSIQDSRKLYRITLDEEERELLTNKNQVLARWKEHFEEHLNEGSKSEQQTRPVDLTDDGVDIDLPSCEEIQVALKYLQNNKAAGANSIAAELLENGGPNLVDALHDLLQQTLTKYWLKCHITVSK